MIVFDIETQPQKIDRLKQAFDSSYDRKKDETDLAKSKEPFDEQSVKLGNLKDSGKIAAKINAARQGHAAKQLELRNGSTARYDLEFAKFVDKSPLSAIHGEVLAIGYMRPKGNGDGSFVIDTQTTNHGKSDERNLLSRFWYMCDSQMAKDDIMVGLNIYDFDLPFLVRRSWIVGVAMPEWVDSLVKSRYSLPLFVDLRKVWLCGQHPASSQSSFAALGLAFGTGGKNVDGVTGADFHKMFWSSAADRKVAIQYLRNDLEQPAIWAEKMGIV